VLAHDAFMRRDLLFATALVAIGFVAALAYSRITQPPAAPELAVEVDRVHLPAARFEPSQDAAPHTAAPAVPNIAASAASQVAAPAARAADDLSTWLTRAADPNDTQRARAITRLGSAPKYEVTPTLKTLAADENREVRQAAVRALGVVALRQGGYDDLEIRRVLQEAAKDKDPQVSRQAFFALTRLAAAEQAR
jgi:hypothetical protein